GMQETRRERLEVVASMTRSRASSLRLSPKAISSPSRSSAPSSSSTMFEACAWALLIVASNVTRRGEGAWRVTSPLPSSRDRTVSTVVCAGAGSSNVAWMVRALIGAPVLHRACITSASSAPAERDLTPAIPSPSVRVLPYRLRYSGDAPAGHPQFYNV